jgi:hypothetical protein
MQPELVHSRLPRQGITLEDRSAIDEVPFHIGHRVLGRKLDVPVVFVVIESSPLAARRNPGDELRLGG